MYLFRIKNVFIKIAIFFLILISQVSFAQNINTLPFEQLTKKNGLTSNMIHQITKDKNGFIWIATNDGLVRFDGVNQRVYKSNPQQKNTISGNRTRSLLYDNDGQLWVGTVGNGLNIYNQELDNFTSFQSDKNNPKTLSNNDVLCIFQDSKNRIWVGTEQGLNLFNPKDKTFQRFLPDENNPKAIGSNAILKIFEDSKGHIWIGTWDGGLNLLIPEKNDDFSFLTFKKNVQNPYAITANHIWDFVEDNNNRIWLATFDGGLVTFDMPKRNLQDLTVQDFKFKSYNKELQQFSDNRLFAISKDNKGDIWVGTSVGLGIFSPDELLNNPEATSIFHTFLFSREEIKTLPHNEIRNIYFDEEQQIIWISTFGGIGYHFMSKKKFELYHSPVANQALSATITSKSKNIQYLGLFSGGVIEYNTKTKATRTLQHNTTNTNYDRILSLAEFGDTIWIGSQAGFSLFDKRTKKLQIVNQIPEIQSLGSFSVIKFFKDSKKRIWIATTLGLIQTDLSLSKVKIYAPNDKNSNAISDEMVTDIEEDKNGNLWIVTCGGGLNKLTFDKNGKAIFKSYGINSRTDNKAMTDLLIYSEIDDESQVIWLGSEVGVLKYLINEDKFINDLPFGRSRVFGFELIDNNIWFSDSDGMTKYDIQEDRISVYNTTDGLPTGGFLHYAYSFDEAKNLLFFGGADGYQLFNPNEIMQDNQLNPLRITDLKIFNKSIGVNEVDDLTNEIILTKNITNTESITLSYLHTSLSLSVTPLDYEHANRYLYAYKLESLEKDWQYTKNTEINYSRLPHGTYTFRIKAQNSDGFWSPETTLQIIVVPPFWKRWDFIILANLLIAGIIGWFIYSKVKQANLERENLENLVLNTSTALPDEMQSLSAEDILRENKVFFEKLYIESPLGIAFANNNFDIIKYNDKFGSIFQNETIEQQQIFDFIAPEKQTHYLTLIKSLTEEQEKTFRQDIPYLIDNEEVWLNTAFSFLYENKGELRYIIIKVSNVTERKKQEKIIQSLVEEVQEKNEELEEKVALRTKDLKHTNKELIVKNEELARFAYIASHDLKEPLRNISSFVGLINRRAKKETLSPEILEYLDFVKLNTHQMHTIVNDVLEYSKFDKNEFVVEMVDLNQLFNEVQLVLTNFIAENNAQITIPTLPIINSNRGFLLLIMKNLIGNGIKYNDNDIPKIEVIFEENTTQYCIKIKDNGIGIEPEYFELIFKMFKRLHTRDQYKGSGLGLAISKRIAEKIGGELKVESTFGKGSTFVLVHPKY